MKIKLLKKMIGNQPDDAEVEFIRSITVQTKSYLKLASKVLWLI